ncbi:glutaminyl-peptide cyclotransferase [Ancylomarina euxinus]|uniref:Glutaminyl-peptide cyclotransferase n=1 Tax=Ancylomarina euxinus TaxID=2283627 RepID=A0A425XZL9_9BACT|nr:glutaminyl-peptide cyclotransferase [Ancylomarina euxinus]MCZ4695447.1 glutaminyl-peptide cyclotransferase [Ancylomarina euxinus]MUP15735.1 glutaminyl-peptide cyclotransferase [Ancylomarina euxinus]RRG20725.1 glutaminyl-peptide cyclotransferase [Ancylomarina euxinus]
MKLQSLIIYLCLVSLTACNGNGAHKTLSKTENEAQIKVVEYIHSLKLKNPQRAKLFAQGDTIEISIKKRQNSEAIDSLQLFIDGKVNQTILSKPWTFSHIAKEKTMGKHNFQLMAYHKDGKVGNISSYYNLKSNIAPKELTYKIVNTFPHDVKSYTQGLFYHDGYLYEGTGQYGESTLRKIDIPKGNSVFDRKLEPNYFGEGITYYGGNIIQLTWRESKAFVIDAEDFSQKDYFKPPTTNGQAWGITTMNNQLVISDGSNILTLVDPKSYSKIGDIEVYDEKGLVDTLNELEYINGKIYANVWLTDTIVVINPKTGRVEANLNLENILSPAEKRKLIKGDDVLNGIAYDSINNRLFVTGKRWSKLFEIKID